MTHRCLQATLPNLLRARTDGRTVLPMTTTTATGRTAALARTCPTCNARPFTRCVTTSGAATTAHTTRVHAAATYLVDMPAFRPEGGTTPRVTCTEGHLHTGWFDAEVCSRTAAKARA